MVLSHILKRDRMNKEYYDFVCFTGLKRSGKDTSADLLIKQLDKSGVEYKRLMLADKLKEFLMNALNHSFVTRRLTMDDMNGDTDFDREENIKMDVSELDDILRMFLGQIDKYLSDNNIDSSFNLRRSLAKNHILDTYESPVDNLMYISVRRMLQVFGTDIARCDDNELWSKITVDTAIRYSKDKGDIKYILTDMRMDVEIEYIMHMGFKPLVVEIINRRTGEVPNHITDMGISKPYIDCIIDNDGSLEKLEKNVNKLNKDILKWN